MVCSTGDLDGREVGMVSALSLIEVKVHCGLELVDWLL